MRDAATALATAAGPAQTKGPVYRGVVELDCLPAQAAANRGNGQGTIKVIGLPVGAPTDVGVALGSVFAFDHRNVLRNADETERPPSVTPLNVGDEVEFRVVTRGRGKQHADGIRRVVAAARARRRGVVNSIRPGV